MIAAILGTLAVAVVTVGGYLRYKRYIASLSASSSTPMLSPAVRLTSEALRNMPSPWRVVHEIGADKLGGIDHVAIGPTGVFCLLSDAGDVGTASSKLIGAAALARREFDTLLRTYALSSTASVLVHWVRRADANPDTATDHGASGGEPAAVEAAPGLLAVRGSDLVAWLQSNSLANLTPSQIDLAWNNVLVSIGRPAPLA